MLSTNPCPPAKCREKGGKRREIYKFNCKTTLLITPVILIILIIRERKQNIENWYRASWSWVPGHWCARWAPGSPRLDSTVVGNWTQESMDPNLDKQAGQGAGSFSEGSHGWTEWAPNDPPALNWGRCFSVLCQAEFLIAEVRTQNLCRFCWVWVTRNYRCLSRLFPPPTPFASESHCRWNPCNSVPEVKFYTP